MRRRRESGCLRGRETEVEKSDKFTVHPEKEIQ